MRPLRSLVPRGVIAWRLTTRHTVALAREGRDTRPAGREGRRQPRCWEDPGWIDGRPQGAADRKVGKVQPPFAHGERMGTSLAGSAIILFMSTERKLEPNAIVVEGLKSLALAGATG